MGTARQVLDGLVAQLTPLWTGFSPAVICGVGWPSRNMIESVATEASGPLVMVYDGDGTRNTTRWLRTPAAKTAVPPAPGVTAALSSIYLLASGSLTITLSGSPNTNDAVVFSAQPLLLAAILSNATATLGETLAQMATALAASITTNGTAVGVAATATGPVVTVTNAGTTNYTCMANSGNIGSQLWENARLNRFVRICAWTVDEPTRQTVTDPIASQLAYLENYFGYHLMSGEGVRLIYHSDAYVEDAQLADTYRRDFRLSLEYGVTQLDTLYPVLGTSLSFTPATN